MPPAQGITRIYLDPESRVNCMIETVNKEIYYARGDVVAEGSFLHLIRADDERFFPASEVLRARVVGLSSGGIASDE